MSVRNAILVVFIIEGLLAALACINYGFHLEALQATTRFSGRFSLAIFSLIFLFHGSQKFAIKNVLSEKYFLAFAIAHAIHLIQLLTFVYLSGNELIPLRLVGGFMAYLMIFFMPLAQHRYDTGKISDRNYTLLTWIYLLYVWFVFFMSYLPRVQGKLPNVGGNYSEFVLLLSWVSLMMGIKIQQLISSRINQ